jgi:ATP-binding cassette subfamily B protein
MKWILKLTGKHLWAIALLCLFAICLTLAGVLQALAMANFLDFAASGDKAGFLRWFGIYFGLIFFQLVGGAAQGLFQQSVSNSLYNSVRLRFFRTVLTREYGSLRDKKSGELMQLISSDTSILVGSVLGLPQQICSLLTQLIGASLCLTFLQGKLALLLLGCFVVMLAAGLPLRKFVRKYHKLLMEASGKVLNVHQEALGNLLIIRAFQATDGVLREAKDKMNAYRKIMLRKACVSQAIHSGSSAAINVAYIIGMLWCGMGIVNGSVSFGTFSAVWQLIGQITGPARQIAGILPQYYTMTASADRLKELENLNSEKENTYADWEKAAEDFTAICSRNLTFSYDNTDQNTVLRDMTFTINRGDFIAITGESGIGKSTFLKLLLGIYHPETPSIAIQLSDGETIPLDAGARNMISYVPQGNFLMSGTIREAVHFWQGDTIDEEKLREACRIAEADGFIEALDDGYETPLGERGAGLSEGQLQRLAIARAIYSGKPVLLLDEATSALDEQTEANVLNNLRQLKNRTFIIVTHRKAALDICNRIVEMDAGRICEHNE